MGLSLFTGSHRSWNVNIDIESLAYQQERTDVSLAVPFSEHFGSGLRNPVYGEQHHDCVVFNEQRFVSFSSSFGGDGSYSYLNSHKETVYSRIFPVWSLQCLGRCPFEIKDCVFQDDVGNTCFQVDPVIRSEPSGRSFFLMKTSALLQPYFF